MIVNTKSGSTYEINLVGLTVRRLPDKEEHSLRRDEEWLKLLCVPPIIKVGHSIVFTLEPLDPKAEFTTRVTSVVTEIVDDNPEV